MKVIYAEIYDELGNKANVWSDAQSDEITYDRAWVGCFLPQKMNIRNLPDLLRGFGWHIYISEWSISKLMTAKEWAIYWKKFREILKSSE